MKRSKKFDRTFAYFVRLVLRGMHFRCGGTDVQFRATFTIFVASEVEKFCRYFVCTI